mgnify:CR=1 FL=1
MISDTKSSKLEIYISMKKMKVIIALIAFAVILSSMTIDLQNLFNYANQSKPAYITKDNTISNAVSNEGATLGRVLFYDKKLSSNNTISCASCHHQQFAFGDTSWVSQGVNGSTARHSMRLVNNRFADEQKFFWDERADSLEMQSTMPIRDHIEMGYSGTSGDPTFQDLINKLDTISYYNHLFSLAYGDTVITELKIQKALAQFIRSIQSFDAPYDLGRNQVGNDTARFPNFNNGQNLGKDLFMTPAVFDNTGSRIGGGFGCASCHRPPEFDIDPNSRSNGILFTPMNTTAAGGIDTIVHRSPSLRDLVNTNGDLNGRLMHTGNFVNLNQILNHYNTINLFPQAPGIGQAIDARLVPNGNPQQLNMTGQERNRIVSFLGTLTGTDLYVNPKWSDPFDANGSLTILNSPLSSLNITNKIDFSIYIIKLKINWQPNFSGRNDKRRNIFFKNIRPRFSFIRCYYFICKNQRNFWRQSV